MKHPLDFDKALAAQVAKLPKRVAPLMVFASATAAPVSIGIIFILLIVFALITNDNQLLKTVLLGVLLSPIAEISKLITRRRRPETLYVKRMWFKTYSFPSGHSYISVLVFGFLAELAVAASPYGFIISYALALLALTVGISRVYLGAHFPSDVLVGWALGCAVLIFWVKLGF